MRFIILGLYIWLAWVRIATFGLWTDEASAAILLDTPLSEMVMGAFLDTQSVCYIVLIKLWSLLFGTTELSLRSSSVIIGALTLHSTISIVRRITGSFAACMVVGLLMSTNQAFLHYTTQLRPYALVMFLSISSFTLMYRYMSVSGNKTAWQYITVAVVGIFVHFWFFFLIVGQAIAVAVWSRKRWTRIVWVFAAIGIASIPQMIIVMYQSRLTGSLWITPVSVLSALAGSLDFFTRDQREVYLSIAAICILPLITLVRSGVVKTYVDQGKILGVVLLVSVVPIIIALIISYIKPVYYVGRYEVIVLPTAILFAGLLISKAPAVTRWLVIILILFTAITRVQFGYGADFTRRIDSEHQTALTVLAHARDGDIVVYAGYSWPVWQYYYRHTPKAPVLGDAVLFPKELYDHPGWMDLETMAENRNQYQEEAKRLASTLKNKDQNIPARIWLVYDPNNPIDSLVSDEFNATFVKTMSQQKEPYMKTISEYTFSPMLQ